MQQENIQQEISIKILEKKIAELEHKNQELQSINEVYEQSQRLNFRLINALFDSSGFGMLLISPNGEIIRANNLFCQIAGYKVEELLGHNIFDIITNYNKDKTLREFYKLINSGQSQRHYFRKFFNKQGLPTYLQFNVSIQMDMHNKVKGIFIIVEDKTSDRRELNLKSCLYQIARTSTVAQDLSEFYPVIKNALAKIVDVSNFFVALYHPDDQSLSFPFYKDKYDKLFKTKADKTLSWHTIKKKKSLLYKKNQILKLIEKQEIEAKGTIPACWMGTPLKAENKIIGILGIQHYENEEAYSLKDLELLDFISNQIALSINKKLKDNELIREKRNFQSLFDNSPDGIILIDDKATIRNANISFQNLFGFDTGRLIGQSMHIILPDATYIPECEGFIKSIFKNNNQQLETRRLCKDGRIIDVIISGTPVIMEENKRNAYLIYRDIGLMKKHQGELQAALDKAKESDKLKTSFLANLSHEIRTPLNAIVGFSGLLMNLKEAPFRQREKYLRHITNSSDNLVSLIDNIIDSSKIDSGQFDIRINEFNLNDVVNELFEFYRQKVISFNLEDKIRITKIVANKKLVVKLDKTRVRQLYDILLDNALKFTPEGIIEFGYDIQGEHLKLFVNDTGIGIAKEWHEKIFERFVKIEDNPNKIYRGTGIGLFLAKNISQFLTGKMQVTSEKNAGSSFEITFRLSDIQETGVELKPEQKAKGPLPEYNWKDKKLLIVEDTPSNFIFLEAVLKRTQVEIFHASFGQEAIELFDIHPDVDAVLMDLQLPDISGFEVTKYIKEKKPTMPVIIQTAFTFNEEADKAKQHKCNGFLSKPIKQIDLLESLKPFMEAKSEEDKTEDYY